MHVSTADVDDAVLGVFAQLRIPAGGRLNYATLVKEWPRQHLRHADLAESVQRLARLEQLHTGQTADGCHWLELTGPGHVRAAELASKRLPGWSWRLRMWVLKLLRTGTAGYSPPSRRRRLRDRVAPQLDLARVPVAASPRRASSGGR